MPVLFYKEYWGLSAAFTTNHINSLADGDTVFTGNAYGPGVLDDPNEPDILMNYVEKLLKKAGFSDVNDADSRVYHNGLGDIHCGTNVQRVIPDYNWWEF